MKKIVLFVVMAVFVVNVFGQKAIQKITFNVPSLNCEECEAIIENKLWKRIDGITAIDAKWKSKVVKISYAPDRIDSGNLKLLIAEMGFDINDEKADEVEMKKLPKCCQRVVVAKPAETPKPAEIPKQNIPAAATVPAKATTPNKTTPKNAVTPSTPKTKTTAPAQKSGVKPAPTKPAATPPKKTR